MSHNGTHDLPLHIHDNNGLDYTLHGDYYLPDLEVPPTPPLNRWGRIVFDRLQKQHPGRFTRMLLDGTLYLCCHDIGQQAQERYDVLMQSYQLRWGPKTMQKFSVSSFMCLTTINHHKSHLPIHLLVQFFRQIRRVKSISKLFYIVNLIHRGSI